MFYLEQGLTGEALEEHQELGKDAVNEGQEVETEVGQRRQTRHGCTFLFWGWVQTGLFEFISV